MTTILNSIRRVPALAAVFALLASVLTLGVIHAPTARADTYTFFNHDVDANCGGTVWRYRLVANRNDQTGSVYTTGFRVWKVSGTGQMSQLYVSEDGNANGPRVWDYNPVLPNGHLTVQDWTFNQDGRDSYETLRFDLVSPGAGGQGLYFCPQVLNTIS